MLESHPRRALSPTRPAPLPLGIGIGAGGGLGPPPASAPTSSSSSSDSNPLSSAINATLADLLGGAQVAIGAALLGLGVILLVSQTSAGAAAGRGAAGGVRRGLRAIPGVGILA